MRAYHAINGPADYLSWLLGHVSAMMGVLLTVMWGFTFVLLVAHAEYNLAHSVGATSGIEGMALPVEPPVFGLSLGALALTVSRWKGQKAPAAVVVGLVSNLLPLALAFAWPLIRATL